MARRQASSFRPTLDPLESRVVLSVSPTIPSTAEVAVRTAPSPRPILTPEELHRVMDSINQDFATYQGNDTTGILDAIGGIASDVATALFDPNDPNSSSTDDDQYVQGGKGDAQALQYRLQAAVDHLPFEADKTSTLIGETFGVGGLTPSDVDIFRDQFKRLVIGDLKAGRRSGEFIYRTIDSDHPAPPSATVQPDPGTVN